MPTFRWAWLKQKMETLSSKLKRKGKESCDGESPAKRTKANATSLGSVEVSEKIYVADQLSLNGVDCLQVERRKRCSFDFYDCPCEELAKKLLGCLLVSSSPGGGGAKGGSGAKKDNESWKCWGRIVETEAYLGGEDKAAHSYGGRRTERNQAMYMFPGTSYVYSIYGMHCCFNISSRGPGAAVLIRALEPLEGLDHMRICRKVARKEQDLCNGPAKLCQALGIDKTCDQLDLTSSQRLWVELPVVGGAEAVSGSGGTGDSAAVGGASTSEVVESARVGVQYAGEEWAGKLLRFHVRGSKFVSKK